MQYIAFLAGVSSVWVSVPWIMVRGGKKTSSKGITTDRLNRSYIYMSYQITDGFEFALAP